MDNLLTLHLKEEWRMMTSYFSSEKLFIVFPLVLFIVGFIMGELLPLFERAFDMKELVVAFHLLLGSYGVLVGAFGFFADEVAQAWFQDAHLLIHMHAILPISFKKIFTWFYVKDIVYYLGLTIFPLFLGAFLSLQIPVLTFCTLVVSSTLTFLIGVSISFLVSSLYVQNKFTVIFVLFFVAFLFFEGFSLEDLPPLSFFFSRNVFSLIFSIVIFVTFSAGSLAITRPTRKKPKSFSKSQLFLHFDPVLAKELIDVKRSGTWQIIMTSYLFPLFFLYGIFYFSGRLFHFALNIPLVFYAVFIGYLSTLVYSWLNNIDSPSSFVTLPVTMSGMIRRKIKLFLMFSLGVSVVYLFILGLLLEDLSSLPLSIGCMGSTAFYVAAVTAWLCGLYPNTRLFDGTILAKYVAAILPVLILLSIFSFMRSHAVILGFSLALLVLSILLYVNLDRKYENVYIS
jgi:hypothetical protein